MKKSLFIRNLASECGLSVQEIEQIELQLLKKMKRFPLRIELTEACFREAKAKVIPSGDAPS